MSSTTLEMTPPTTEENRANQRELWRRYSKSGPGSATENHIVEQYLPLVKAVVGRLAMTLPAHVNSDDLYSAGLVGLLNAVRRELAARHLANPANSLTQVAGLLGYAQLSSFTRWFIAQFGAPPTRWRAASNVGAGDHQEHQAHQDLGVLGEFGG